MPTLKELRRSRFMSQVDLAKKAGVDSITISRLERGIQKPSLQTVRKLADALEVEVTDIEFQQWPEEEDHWKDLQLPPEVKEKSGDEGESQRLEAEANVITIEGELADRLRLNKPSSPKEEAEEPEPEPKVEMTRTTPAHIGETEVEAETEESARVEPEIVEGTHRVDLGGSVENEAAPESTPVLQGKAADEVEPRAALATATILPFSLLSGKKAWVWIVVLVCVGIAGYFLWRSHSREDAVTSTPKEGVKTSGGNPVKDYLDAHYPPK